VLCRSESHQTRCPRVCPTFRQQKKAMIGVVTIPFQLLAPGRPTRVHAALWASLPRSEQKRRGTVVFFYYLKILKMDHSAVLWNNVTNRICARVIYISEELLIHKKGRQGLRQNQLRQLGGCCAFKQSTSQGHCSWVGNKHTRLHEGCRQRR
jgi:hypothetical protein